MSTLRPPVSVNISSVGIDSPRPCHSQSMIIALHAAAQAWLSSRNLLRVPQETYSEFLKRLTRSPSRDLLRVPPETHSEFLQRLTRSSSRDLLRNPQGTYTGASRVFLRVQRFGKSKLFIGTPCCCHIRSLQQDCDYCASSGLSRVGASCCTV